MEPHPCGMEDDDIPCPSLDWILEASLRWIFVGGKGGVGKTTTACSLASQLSKRQPSKRFLVISTDPAHNTSDAFGQKFTSEPSAVSGRDNLFVMEIDASQAVGSFSLPESAGPAGGAPENDFLRTLRGMTPDLQSMMQHMPGVDEAMSFMEIVGRVDSLDYDVIIFDTAPTGHTLRLLGMPSMIQKMLSTVRSLQSSFGGVLGSLMSSFAGNGTNPADAMREATEKMEKIQGLVDKIAVEFKDPEKTTFIPVMIPEFLSLYETERLVQELAKNEMDVASVVVNQVLVLPNESCGLCKARSAMQKKYIEQAQDLYGLDFHLVTLPLLEHEVRGLKELTEFGDNLFEQKICKDDTKQACCSCSK